MTRDRCPVPGVTRVPVSPLATVSPLTLVSPRQCHIMIVTPQVGTRTRGQDSGRCFTAGFTLWLYLSFGPPLPLWHTKEPTLWTKHNEDVELWTRMYRTLYKEDNTAHSFPAQHPICHAPSPGLHPPPPPGSGRQVQDCHVHPPSSPGQDTETLHSGSRNAVFMHLRYFHI